MKKNLYIMAVMAFLPAFGGAQSALFIDTSFTAEQMVTDFFSNSCVTPSNVTFNGTPAMIGYFEAAGTDLGVNAGIVISTGKVSDLINEVSYFSNTNNGLPGDADLQALAMYPTFDASILEFDITVSDEGDLEFQYVFGSEEYPEYVGTTLNDVFAFFIKEVSASNMVNIALVPGTSTPVAINNVNAGLNDAYFVDYEAQNGQHVALDGLTTVLPATFGSSNGQTYHVKIAVSDVGDQIFDSGVFISTLSLCGPGLVEPNTFFSMQVQENSVFLENKTRYATSWHWDFGDGTSSEERYPEEHVYAQPGTYTITLTTQNYCCSTAHSQEVVIGPSSAGDPQAEGFGIFPNPVQDQLTIQGEGEKAFFYEIRDISGRLAAQGEQRGSLTLQTSGWNRGLYLLTLRTEKGVYTRKLSLH